MDPDQALAYLRNAFEGLRNYDDREYWNESLMSAIDLAVDSFDALDEWLKKGGYLPKDWATGFPDSPYRNDG